MPNSTPGYIKIIAGQWRGRKIAVPEVAGLRPTPSRVRETVFNWLATKICGANCLDLFAGSGALGIEALSRGATQVTFVDAAKKVVKHLQTILTQLDSHQHEIIYASIPKLDLEPRYKYSIVFLDPPFHKGLVTQAINWLIQQDCLTDDALIYIESENAEFEHPDTWQMLKQKQAGQVWYLLFKNA